MLILSLNKEILHFKPSCVTDKSPLETFCLGMAINGYLSLHDCL